MADDLDRFEAATQAVASLVADGRLQQATTLRLYGLYKQATEGACSSSKPSLFDQRGRAKWAAWQALGDMPPDAAGRAYVALLDEAQPGWDAVQAQSRGGSGAMGPVFSSLGAAPDDDDLVRSPRVEAGGQVAAAVLSRARDR